MQRFKSNSSEAAGIALTDESYVVLVRERHS